MTPDSALVFFGASGDLAYKKVFPALHELARRGELEMPVIGVARTVDDRAVPRAGGVAHRRALTRRPPRPRKS